MNDTAVRTVLDCMVFAQALISPRGPAGKCVEFGTKGEFRIVLSPYVISEILELPNKLPPKFTLSDEQVTAFLDEVIPAALLIQDVPHVFDHPIDPDDSGYIDLALATGAKLIVSRDRHLLGLNNPAKPWSAEFRRRFPEFKVLTPEDLLVLLRQSQMPQRENPEPGRLP